MSAQVPVYSIKDHQLVITDSETGETCWSGLPLGAPVSDAKAVPGTDRAVVLLDYLAQPNGPFRNLICVAADGTVIWTAELPTSSSTEAYVSFDLDVDGLHANSWECYWARIALDSGEILDQVFIK